MTANVDLLGQLHVAVAEGLLKRITSGEATAADFGAAITMLKNNSITAQPEGDSALADLKRLMEERNKGRKPVLPDPYAEAPPGLM